MGTLTNSAKLIEKIQNMRSVVTGNTAPSNPSAGDLWYDTTSTVKALKMYDGTSWVIVGPELVSLTQAEYDALPAAEKSNGKFYLITDASGSISIAWSQITGAPISSGSSAPSNPNEGDIWYDTTNDVLKSYDGTNWNEVGSDVGDINTKTFYLSSTSDLTTAQAAWNWHLAGKNPIINFLEKTYILNSIGSGYAIFTSTYRTGMTAERGSRISSPAIQLNLSSGTVTGIIENNDYNAIVYLSTDRNYQTPYTPLYDGSPATKKYVDDSVSAITVPTKVSDLTNDSNFQTDTQVSQAISSAVSSAYKYKGSVANQSALPASGNTEGDVWNTADTGMNYAWTGSAWDALGATVDLSNYLAKNNTTAFTPTGDYQPATKKYVDDNAGTEYNAGEGIEIKNGPDYSAMQGPCDSGFHIPLKSEWEGLKTIMTSLSLTTGAQYKTNLHMPFVGYRAYSDGLVRNQANSGDYWASNIEAAGRQNAYYMSLYSSDRNISFNYFGFAYSIRAFKNEYVAPTSSWTVIAGTLGNAGIFWNSTAGLITVTNGTTGYTIQDKNVGATTVYNDGDTLSEANMGNLFQRGNNYGFSSSTSVTPTTSTTQVDTSSYGPENPYYSSTYIIDNKNWQSTTNGDLWGGETGVVTLENAITNTGVLSVNGETGDVIVDTSEVSGVTTEQPSDPVAGSTYYDTTNNVIKVYNGTSWQEVGGGNVIAMTQSEYDALPAATKNDGKLRIITDAPTLDIVDDTAFGASWDGDTDTAPSKNAVYDAIGNIETLLAAI